MKYSDAHFLWWGTPGTLPDHFLGGTDPQKEVMPTRPHAPSSRPVFEGDHLWITPWVDAVVDGHGVDVRSHYVEHVWLGVLGPSTVWLLRRLVDGLDGQTDGYALDLAETAAALGLGGHGRNSPLIRSVGRACQFGLARQIGPAQLEVRRRVPPASQGQLARLPLSARRVHDSWMRADRDQGGDATIRRLASTLVEVAESPDEAAQLLERLRVAPAAAHDAVAWARAQRAAGKPPDPDPGVG